MSGIAVGTRPGGSAEFYGTRGLSPLAALPGGA